MTKAITPRDVAVYRAAKTQVRKTDTAGGSKTVIVNLPRREDAKTHAFRVSKRRWNDKGVTLVSITGLDDSGQPLAMGIGRQAIVIALDDLPLVLAGIRQVLAGPLEELLLEAEAHYRSMDGGSDEPETPG